MSHMQNEVDSEKNDLLNIDPSLEPESPEPEQSFWSEILPFVIVALAVVLPLRLFVVQPFIVSGASMDPTFSHGHYLIVDELTYRFREPERGEVVIFRFPGDPKKFLIKRVIGLPGETVEVEEGIVSIYPFDDEGYEMDKITLDETYVNQGSLRYLKTSLGEDEYFVMGDNRPASSDSRSWGPIDERAIIGRPYVRLFPLSQMGFHPGDFSDAFIMEEEHEAEENLESNS